MVSGGRAATCHGVSHVDRRNDDEHVAYRHRRPPRSREAQSCDPRRRRRCAGGDPHSTEREQTLAERLKRRVLLRTGGPANADDGLRQQHRGDRQSQPRPPRHFGTGGSPTRSVSTVAVSPRTALAASVSRARPPTATAASGTSRRSSSGSMSPCSSTRASASSNCTASSYRSSGGRDSMNWWIIGASPSALDGRTLRLNGIGDFTCGGPHGDNGAVGQEARRRPLRSTCPNRWGALCGKDPHKPDRVGPLRARQVAVRLARATKPGCDGASRLAARPRSTGSLERSARDGQLLDSDDIASLVAVPNLTLAGSAAISNWLRCPGPPPSRAAMWGQTGGGISRCDAPVHRTEA
jgi:hypothetical protein